MGDANISPHERWLMRWMQPVHLGEKRERHPSVSEDIMKSTAAVGEELPSSSPHVPENPLIGQLRVCGNVSLVNKRTHICTLLLRDIPTPHRPDRKIRGLRPPN